MNSPRRETHFIVLPGGGYAAYAENEAEPIVNWLGALGIPASVLHYPLHARHPLPLNALRSEVRRLRATGAARVGVAGFSAGGHLGGHAALSEASSPDTRIDLAVLGYPITSMEMETYRPARLILLGDDAPPELRRMTSLDALCDSRRPTVLRLAHGRGSVRPRQAQPPAGRCARGAERAARPPCLLRGAPQPGACPRRR